MERLLRWLPQALARWFPALAAYRRRLAERLAQAAIDCEEQEPDAALDYLARAIMLEPGEIQFIYHLGRLNYERREFELAREWFQRALGIDFFNLDALKGLGYSLHMLSEMDDAVYCYLRYLQSRPDDADVHTNLIQLLTAMSRYEDAVAACERASEEFPEDATYPLLAAKNSFEIGNVESAMKHGARALELAPDHPETRYFMGSLLAASGQMEQAIQQYEKAIELNPGNADAYMDLALAFEACHRDADYLVAMRKARERYEEQGNEDRAKFAYWGEGWGYYKARRWRESIAASEQAVRIDGTLASARFNLGLALLRAGDSARATEEYQKAVELGNHGALKTDGIEDLEDALKEEPNLPGAREILKTLLAAHASGAATRTSRPSAA